MQNNIVDVSRQTLLHYLYLELKYIDIKYNKNITIYIRKCSCKKMYYIPIVSDFKTHTNSNKITVFKFKEQLQKFYNNIDKQYSIITLQLIYNEIWPYILCSKETNIYPTLNIKQEYTIDISNTSLLNYLYTKLTYLDYKYKNCDIIYIKKCLNSILYFIPFIYDSNIYNSFTTTVLQFKYKLKELILNIKEHYSIITLQLHSDAIWPTIICSKKCNKNRHQVITNKLIEYIYQKYSFQNVSCISPRKQITM
jgi:hypothetical protein